jgi:hypothetical protein
LSAGSYLKIRCRRRLRLSQRKSKDSRKKCLRLRWQGGEVKGIQWSDSQEPHLYRGGKIIPLINKQYRKGHSLHNSHGLRLLRGNRESDSMIVIGLLLNLNLKCLQTTTTHLQGQLQISSGQDHSQVVSPHRNLQGTPLLGRKTFTFSRKTNQ